MSTKEQYRRKMQAELDQWKAELDQMKARARAATAQSRIQLDRRIEELERRIAEGKAKLDELAEATGDRWETLKSGVDKAWDSLKEAFAEATETRR